MPRNKLWEDFQMLINSVFRVVSESSVAIKELAVERLEPACHEMGLFSSAFVNRSSTETGYIGNVLANLTKLRFILTRQLVGRRWRKKPIAGFLAQARNLEVLFLEWGPHSSMDLQGTATLPMITGFQSLLEKCSFPMLKTLYVHFGLFPSQCAVFPAFDPVCRAIGGLKLPRQIAARRQIPELGNC